MRGIWWRHIFHLYLWFGLMVPQLLLGLDNFRLEYLLLRIMSFYGVVAIKVGISSFMSELSYNVYADIYFSFYVKFRKTYAWYLAVRNLAHIKYLGIWKKNIWWRIIYLLYLVLRSGLIMPRCLQDWLSSRWNNFGSVLSSS